MRKAGGALALDRWSVAARPYPRAPQPGDGALFSGLRGTEGPGARTRHRAVHRGPTT